MNRKILCMILSVFIAGVAVTMVREARPYNELKQALLEARDALAQENVDAGFIALQRADSLANDWAINTAVKGYIFQAKNSARIAGQWRESNEQQYLQHLVFARMMVDRALAALPD